MPNCSSLGGAFGSDVKLTATGLDNGKEYVVSAPADREHVLVVRLAQAADGKVTATKEVLAATQ